MLDIKTYKELTKGKEIRSIPDPPLLMVPVPHKFGFSPEPVVKPGEKVLRFQVIASEEKKLSPAVHSPVSGTVREIEEVTLADGSKVKAVAIENDFRNREADTHGTDAQGAGREKLLQLLASAGVVGMGGAEFPTAKKYDIGDKKVELLIINGAECEPFLTSDYALLSKKTGEFIKGVSIAGKILSPEKIILAVEQSNEELKYSVMSHPDIRQLKVPFEVSVVPDEYPQGGELQLIQTLTGMEIPKGAVPIEQGIVVSNAGTIHAIYNAVENGRPLVERFITVSGDIPEDKTGVYRVSIGTPVRHILDHLDIDPTGYLFVSGGPMMSPHINDLSVPVTKGMLGLVALDYRRPQRMNCIWCGYCADVCPMYLMPMEYAELFRRGNIKQMENYSLMDCIECASCEYICPSNVPLIESIKKGKAGLKKLKDDGRP